MNPPKIYIFSGASQTGKTTKAINLMQTIGNKTVFAWDIEAQFCELKGFKKITDIRELGAIVKRGEAGKYAFVCKGDIKKGFEQFCACVFHFAEYFGACTCIAEELADVTSQSKAGDYWGMCVRRGLKRGLSIIAISQRWQEADKTAIGNANEVFIFAPSTKKDAVYLADTVSVTVQELLELKPYEYMHWVKFQGVTKNKLTKL
jgi:hypothetical protein